MDVNYCSRVEDFHLLPGVPVAIRHLNEAGYKVIVITNQSGIARGKFTYLTLAEIHWKMKHELQKSGANIDDIFFCPHLPDRNCDCRKPKIKLLDDAIQRYNISIKDSYFIGDAQKDIEAGREFGCRTVLVKTGIDKGENAIDKGDFTADNLLEAVLWILENRHNRLKQVSS